MFHLRSYFNVCAKLYKLPLESCFIHKIVKYRQFQTSSIVSERKHHGLENKFAHDVLESNEKYKVIRVKQNVENNINCENIDLNQNWSNLTTDNLLVHFEMIGSYCKNHGLSISEERFDKFVDVCTERCFDFTDDQLRKSLRILSHYPQTKSPYSRNFVELWNALDDACVDRIERWDFNMILYLCDHWHMLRLAKLNKFNLRGSLKIGRKLRKLPPHQMVQTMFYVNIKRKPILEMFEFEANLLNTLDQLSLNEIAIMCMGFFKTQTRMKTPDLVTNIFERLIREMDTVPDIPLVCILKVLFAMF